MGQGGGTMEVRGRKSEVTALSNRLRSLRTSHLVPRTSELLAPGSCLRDTTPMPDFSDFDARGYRTVDVRSGYRDWVPTYESTVEDAMDIALLEALKSPPCAALHSAADLGGGTGGAGAAPR